MTQRRTTEIQDDCSPKRQGCYGSLRDVAERRELTNGDIARGTGLAESAVSQMTRGYWGTKENRERVAEFLGASADELFPNVPPELR